MLGFTIGSSLGKTPQSPFQPAWSARATPQSAGFPIRIQPEVNSHPFWHFDAEHGHAMGDGGADQGTQGNAHGTNVFVLFLGDGVVLVEA